jgi:hypothetical protein
MTTRTRYFVIASLLVLTVGVGTGLVAYYVGFPTSAFTTEGGAQELRYVPRDAAVVAFANVQEIMTSELRQRIKATVPIPENGQQEFANRTGINIETDIDRLVACLQPSRGTALPSAGMVVATGRFDSGKIESLMREHGAQVETYRDRRLIVGTPQMMHGGDRMSTAPDTAPSDLAHSSFALAFLKPGVIAVGSTPLVRGAIDQDATGGDNITLNDEVMTQVKAVDSGNNAWAIGRFDALQTQAHLPPAVASQIPPITWFSIGTHINGGVRGTLTAQTRDVNSANNLRDVVRGFLGLAKMQAGSKPEIQAMIQSLEVEGTGNAVTLSFMVPAQIFDAAAARRGLEDKQRRH